MLVEKLSKQSGVSPLKLKMLAATASRRYKVYEIPKRASGTRTIEHPSRELKAVQRWVTKTVFDQFPIHANATAYKRGASIRDNAERHRASNYTTRFDFIGFFPSFRRERVALFLNSKNQSLGLELTDEDVKFVCDIVCRNGRLTIGAPSSPTITNVMMYSFDQGMAAFCDQRNVIYTRYADDIFVSSRDGNSLSGFENEIRRLNRGADHLALRINHKKTAFLSRKYSRKLAGIVITPDRKLSIGRHRKREIKALIYLWVKGELPRERHDYLRGLLAFAKDVEPDFEERMTRKYGPEPIHSILHEPFLGDFLDDGDDPF